MIEVLKLVNWMRVKNHKDLQVDSLDVKKLTQMKAMKLLYYMQAASLVIYNEKLFSNDIVAWDYGPVVKEVNSHYHGMKSIVDNIDKNAWIDYSNIEKDKKYSFIINWVVNKFNSKTAHDLMKQTHHETPWKVTPRNQVIELSLLKDYFTKNNIFKGCQNQLKYQEFEQDIPNKESMSSIYEAIDDMHDHHLKAASSYEELEKILDE